LLSTLTTRSFRPVFVTAALLAFGVSAHATTVTFGTGGTAGFTNGGTSDGPANVGGVNLTATAWASGGGPTPVLTANSEGYGVDSDGNGNGDSNEVDGQGRDEAVVLTFSAPVTVTNIVLMNFSSNDDSDLIIDGILHSSGIMHGSEFRIRADEDNSDFRVRSITFDVASSAVPEPATLLTGGLGLALVALARRRS